MQIDIDALTEKDIRAIVKKHQLSQEQAQTLLQKEKSGSARANVLTMLAAQVRKAKRRRELKESQDELISSVWHF